MIKKLKVPVTDVKYIGEEPCLTKDCTQGDIINAYNWYNYVCDTADAVEFVTDYLKQTKASKDDLKKISKIQPFSLRTIGWNCRILTCGGYLPEEIIKKNIKKLNDLLSQVDLSIDTETPEEPKNVISIQERIKDKAIELIGTIEVELDKFFMDNSYEFDVVQWFREQNIKPVIAKKISEYYNPLYSELFDALKNEDPALKEYYRHWSRSALKKYAELVRSIIAAAETNLAVANVTRRPRKKKEKPAALVVKKLQYKEKDDETNITSIVPTGIVGADQLWTYNTKSRALTVYNSLGPVGLGVKGTTIVGYDEKTSITKKLRKPEETLPRVLDGGKIVLRKLMDDLTTKSKEANGRINKDTILLRALK